VLLISVSPGLAGERLFESIILAKCRALDDGCTFEVHDKRKAAA
jgi:hypothetical protein